MTAAGAWVPWVIVRHYRKGGSIARDEFYRYDADPKAIERQEWDAIERAGGDPVERVEVRRDA